MNLLKLLRLINIALVVGLFMLSSVLAVSDSSESFSDESSYGFSTNLIVFGLVGSNILSVD